MDDFKVVIYIVGAIIWLIYQNYQKVAEQSRKRDISKPFEEELPTAPPVKDPLPARPVNPPNQGTFKRTDLPKKSVVPRLAGSRQKTHKVSSSISMESQPVSYMEEGGGTKPSQTVRFDEPSSDENSSFNPIAEEIRNADFRRAFILSEVLQRPYN